MCSKTRRIVTRKRRKCFRVELRLRISHGLRLVFQFYAMNQGKKGINSDPDPKQLEKWKWAEQKAVEFITTDDQRKSVVFQLPWTWMRALWGNVETYAKIYSNTVLSPICLVKTEKHLCRPCSKSKRDTWSDDACPTPPNAPTSPPTSLFSKGRNNAQSVYNTTLLSINAKYTVISYLI